MQQTETDTAAFDGLDILVNDGSDELTLLGAAPYGVEVVGGAALFLDDFLNLSAIGIDLGAATIGRVAAISIATFAIAVTTIDTVAIAAVDSSLALIVGHAAVAIAVTTVT